MVFKMFVPFVALGNVRPQSKNIIEKGGEKEMEDRFCRLLGGANHSGHPHGHDWLGSLHRLLSIRTAVL